MNPEDCPHPGGEFVDVVFTPDIGYEQRFRCGVCSAMMHIHIGPFGPQSTRVVVEH